MEARKVAIGLTLSNGVQLDTHVEVLDIEDDDSVLEDLQEELTHRPQWQVIGDVLVFSGALSAIILR